MSNELWAYFPGTNSWEMREPLPAGGRHYARAYSVLGRGVILSGQNGTGSLADGWVYSPWSDSWLPIEDYPGEGGWSGAQFTLNARIFAGLGQTSGSSFIDLWELKEIPIGVPENDMPYEFEVYPTVFAGGGSVHIRCTFAKHQDVTMILTDTQGRRVAYPLRSVDLNTFQLPAIAPGTYVLTLSIDGYSNRSQRILVIP